MKNKFCFLLVFIISVLFLSCAEENFQPYSEDNGSMVYCILDNRLPYQFAVMQKSCIYGNVKKMPSNTLLVLSENNGDNYYFRDTVIQGYENYSCYYLPNIDLKRKTNYRLTAISDSIDTQYSELVFFQDPGLRFVDTVILDPMYRIRGSSMILLGYRDREVALLDFSKTSGYYSSFRWYIEYDLKYGGKITSGKIEIPTSLRGTPEIDYREGDDLVYHRYDYENVSASYSKFYSSSYSANSRLMFRDYDEIFYALRFLNPHEIDKSKPVPDEVKIKRAFIVYFSIDKNIYEYSRGSNADYSIRLDESFYYTNIFTDHGKGSGYFAANAADTLVFKIRPDHLALFGYKDGQK